MAAMVAGVSINRPARRTPWLLLAAANLTGTLGEVASHVYATVTHAPVPFPSFADVIYLAAYPLYVAGLAMFIRSRSTGRDARSTIDALVLLVGLILLSWVFLVMPDAAYRVAVLAAADRERGLPGWRPARPGDARAAAHARHGRAGRQPCCSPSARSAVSRPTSPTTSTSGHESPDRCAALARLAGQRHRLGRRRAAPVDGRADQARQAARARRRSAAAWSVLDARVADPAGRPVRSLRSRARRASKASWRSRAGCSTCSCSPGCGTSRRPTGAASSASGRCAWRARRSRRRGSVEEVAAAVSGRRVRPGPRLPGRAAPRSSPSGTATTCARSTRRVGRDRATRPTRSASG